MEGDAVKFPTVCVSSDEVVHMLNEMWKSGKAHGTSDVSLKLIAAGGEVGIQVIAEICQCHRWIWNVS